MKKIDKTKENIKVDELDEKTRKQMFEKFIQAGGKVIDEKESTKTKHVKPVKPSRIPISQKQKIVPKEQKQPKAQNDLMFETWLQKKLSGMFIRFKLFFLGVTGLFSPYIKARFLDNCSHTYKTALLQFQVQYYYIFNPQTSKQIIAKLDEINPMYYELIVMIANVFDRTRFNEIEALEQADLVHIQNLKNLLMPIYKTLYILYPYIELIELAFRNALEIQSSIEKQKSQQGYEKRKIIRNSLYITFYKMLPRLHILFCYYNNAYIDITNPYIRSILQITDDDLPGKRRALKALKQQEKDEEEQKEKEHDEIPPHIARGLSLMTLRTNDILATFPKDSFFQANPADKAIITYALFKKFDDEFSIVLTTNKIKYNIQFTEVGKIDYKNRLTDCYNQLRKVHESFEEYIHILETYERVRAEKPLSNAQYIEYTKRLTQLEKKKKAESKNMRMTTKAVMDTIAAELQTLIYDMDEEHKIIDNPQDFLEFDVNVESVHILQNKKVYEAIHLAYFYACALSYRLSEGDLAGDIEFKEGESPLIPAEQKMDSTQSGKDEKEREPSVIKELEDLF